MSKRLLKVSAIAITILAVCFFIMRIGGIGFFAHNNHEIESKTEQIRWLRENTERYNAGDARGYESRIVLNEEEQYLGVLINEERARGGLREIVYTSRLNENALLKAADMVENNYFSHLSPTMGSPFDMMNSQGVRYTEAAENIVGNQTVEGAVNRWMNTENQRNNIMNGTFDEGGIAVVESPVYGKVMVLLLISNDSSGKSK